MEIFNNIIQSLLPMARKPLVCKINGCNGSGLLGSRGWCRMHYARWQRHGNPLKLINDSSKGCKIEGCVRKHSCNGLCQQHDKELYQINLKEQVYNILNQFVCVRCGFSDKRALQFDHVDGDGYKILKILISSTARLRYYIKNPNYTKVKIQVLCANCNWIKRHENREFSGGG